MLSHKVLTRKDINRAASYYEDSADDYYAKDGDASEWQGAGAKALKLGKKVDRAKFRQLLNGEVAGESTRLFTRHDSKQRIGIDLTFSAPKSVSMQALIALDENIIKAHDRAVAYAISRAEQSAQTRQKIGGQSMVENTGNLIVAKFRHETSRERDPQLHTHAIVMNLTQRKDGEWRALRNDNIIKMTKYLGAVYRAELALGLQKLGYRLRFERDGLFELDHISRDQLEQFSKRSSQIEERLAEQGLSRRTATTWQKQQATFETRQPKCATAREIIFAQWQAEIEQLRINLNIKLDKEQIKALRTQEQESIAAVAKNEAAKQAVRFAVNHLTERQAVIAESALLEKALKHAVGGASTTDIENEIRHQIKTGYLIREELKYVEASNNAGNLGTTRQQLITELIEAGMTKVKAAQQIREAIKQGRLVLAESSYTTQTALAHEQAILKIERSGRNTVKAIIEMEEANKWLETCNLNQGQAEAAKLIATTTNRIIGVQGFAGTGKSHMLKAVKEKLESQGYNMQALAPYGGQVRALGELGIQSKTLASFLRTKNKNLNEQTIIIIDEAGVVPTRLLEQTLKLVEHNKARVVLIGDIAQTQAIEAGRPFAQLQGAGMHTAHMEQIQRQSDETLRKAVELAAKGNTGHSLSFIGNIDEIEEARERYETIASTYTNLNRLEQEQTIIVAGTNDARTEINKMVRDNLGLASQGIDIESLTPRDITKAESRYAKHYHRGDYIQPQKDYGKTGLQEGELYRIVETSVGNRLTVQSATGQQFQFNPLTHQKLAIYKGENIELSAGDIVRITRNDPRADLVNGLRLRVESIQDKIITLTDGNRQIEFDPRKPLYLDHAYATTIHSSQGLTAERVLIDIDTNSLTASKDVYYVAISRAKQEAHIFTNNRQELTKAISRENTKTSALDIIRQRTYREMAGT